MNGTPAIKLDFPSGPEPQTITIQPGKPETKPTPVPAPQTVPIHVQPIQYVPAAAPAAPTPAAVVPRPSSWRRPHPLLYLTLGISLLALVLGVPKGTFPTLTGRHKALRAQEVLVQERLSLLTHMAGFLPPPLAALIASDDSTRSTLDLVRLGTGLQLWNINANSDGVFWTLQDLGNGASVVRSSLNGNSREVWVLRDAEDASPAVVALAAALNEKERVYRDLEGCRASPCECPETNTSIDSDKNAQAEAKEREIAQRESAIVAREREIELEKMRKEDRAAWEKEVEAREEERVEREKELAKQERRRQIDREEREREAAERRRHRQIAEEMEEREREVIRREKWVVDAMRKLSDKARESGNELTMEDRITERLKVYQRQLAELHSE